MHLLTLAVLAVSCLCTAQAWKGYAKTANDTRVVQTNIFGGIGLTVPVTITDVTERVLLVLNMVVKLSTPTPDLKVTIYRDGTNLVATFLKRVTNSLEIEPIVASILDVPGTIGTFVYSVQVKGNAQVSPSLVPRQLMAIIISSNYQSYQAWNSGLIKPPSVASGLTFTIPTQSTSRVLLFYSSTLQNSTIGGDGSVRINRGGTQIGTTAAYAFGSAFSSFMSAIDAPATMGTVSYSVILSRGMGSTYTMNNDNAVSTFVALTIPNNQGIVTSVATRITVVETQWRNILSLAVTPMTETDKIMIMFNADFIFMDSRATTACFTITRNGVNLGHAIYGITTITSSRLYARRSPMMVYLDDPNSSGSVTYGISVKTIEGYEFQLGRENGLETSLSVVLVSDTYLTPSLPPTVAPSSRAPTNLPIDCSHGCNMVNNAVNLVANQIFGMYKLPRYFTFTFEVTVPALPSTNLDRFNLFDLVDSSNGNSLLSVYLTESVNLNYFYNNIEVVDYGPGLVSFYSVEPTTIYISVLPNNQITVESSGSEYWVPTYSNHINVDTTNKIYKLYLSNGGTSAAGAISNVAITEYVHESLEIPVSSVPTLPPSVAPTPVPTSTPKKPVTTLAPSPLPVAPPTLKPTYSPSLVPSAVPSFQAIDCRVSCALHTSQVVSVATNNHIDSVYLSSTFSLSFTINRQTLAPNSTTKRSILEIVNGNDQTNLFAIYATNTAQPRITYGTTLLTEYGPAFNSLYATGGWTTYTLNVYADRVTLVYSVNVNDVRTYYTNSMVDTNDKIYKIYTSGSQEISAGGFIYNILISGLTAVPTLAPSLSPTVGPTIAFTPTPTVSLTTSFPTLAPIPASVIDCRVSCTVRPAQTLTISLGSLVAQVLLPPTFSITFYIQGMSQPTVSTTAMLNLFEISNPSQQLLSFYMSGTRAPTILYANTQVTNGTGPLLSSNYATVWTQYSIFVRKGSVQMQSNADPTNIVTYYTDGSVVDTVGQIYNIWGSNSFVHSSGGALFEFKVNVINPDPTLTPSAAPSLQPTSPPTQLPTTFPSMAPVVGGVLDCTTHCTVSGQVVVSQENKLVDAFIANHFELTFRVRKQGIQSAAKNILSIYDGIGNLLFCMYASTSQYPVFVYNNQQLSGTGAPFAVDYDHVWTEYTVIVGPTSLTITSSANVNSPVSHTYTAARVNDNKLYSVYASSAFETSAGGYIDAIIFKGLTNAPTKAPTTQPTLPPTADPSVRPTVTPSVTPSADPTVHPSADPTVQPSAAPTADPSVAPSADPSAQPSVTPTVDPTSGPTVQPSVSPSVNPSVVPSVTPTQVPSVAPSVGPTAAPTLAPSTAPSVLPSVNPSTSPSQQPTLEPSMQPTDAPTVRPTADPSVLPTVIPSAVPSELPTVQPSVSPSALPSALPTMSPSAGPSVSPSTTPTHQPTRVPSAGPSTLPSVTPSVTPVLAPSPAPTLRPTLSSAAAVPIVSLAAEVDAIHPGNKIIIRVTLSSGDNAIVRCGAVKSTQTVSSVSQIVSQGFSAASTNSVASVVVQGLVPTTAYTVYCATESSFGVIMPLSMVLSHSAAVVTGGTKTVTATLSVRSVNVDSVTPNALLLAVSYLPMASVTFVLSTTSPASVFYPSQVVFTNTSQSTTASVTFAAGQEAALNSITVHVSGPDAETYQVVYPSGSSIQVLSGSDIPVTPQLDSAMFSNDGSTVQLRFSNPTNMAGYTNAFACTSLLRFAGSETATCQWHDAYTIVIYSSNGGERLQVQSPVSLIAGNNLRAQCSATVASSVCADWPIASAVTVYVAAPTTAAAPVLVLTIPVVINSCSSLPVDLSSSTGSGGRAWLAPTFTVTSTVGDSSEIARFLKANFSMTSRTVVPNSKFLDAAGSLVVTVELCNFLGACSTATATVTIDRGTAPIPIVSIPGPSVRSALVSAGLLLTSSAYTLSCNGTQSTRHLRYAWSVLDNGEAVSPEVLWSDSADESKFRVSPYQLQTLHYYTFQLTVTSTLTGAVTMTSVGVNVLQSELVAQVTGGATQTIRVDSTLMLDASLSFDPDSKSTELTYMWSCVQSAPTFNTTCPLHFTAANARQSVLQVSADVAGIGRTSTFTVTVSDATRSAQTQVIVTTVASTAAVVRINSAPDSLVAINAANRLSLTGTVTTPSACQAVWSVDQSTFNLSTIAITPVRTLVPNGATRQINLALSANTLPVRATLTFALTCGQSRSTVVVTTNGPPLPGVFSIEPTEGQEIFTNFLFVASLWSDTELPLSYIFGFVSSVNGAPQVLLGKSEAAFGSSSLPAGTTEAGYQLTCFAKVFDSLDASSNASALVKVTQNPDSLNLVTAALGESSGDVDATKNVISLGGAIMNAVNCTSAPNCTTLHRQHCQSVTNTCGACEVGYVGESGSSNAFCVSAVAAMEGRRRLTTQSCVSDQDCGEGWEVCDKLTNPRNPVCAVPQKQCPNDCSDRGKCLKVNYNSGQSVSDCVVNDPSCVAQCQCVEGYGGKDCSLTVEYLQSRQTLRATFLQSLATILQNDDVDLATVSSWSDGLSALTQDPYELSAESANEVSAFAQHILNTASTVSGFSYENAVGVLDSLSAASASVRHANVSSSNNTISAALRTIAQFNELVASLSVAGQDSVGYYYDAFQLKSVKQFATAGNTIELTTPTAALQTSAAPTVQVSPDTDDELTVSLISTAAASYGDLGKSFNTNPLQLSVTRTAASSTHATFVLTHNSPVGFTNQHEAEALRFLTNCSGLPDPPAEVSSYTCPGSGEVIEHNCTSLPAGTLTSYCPVLAPSCAVLNVTADSIALHSNNSVCVVVTYDAYSTTCNCTISPTNTVTMRRRLESEVAQTGVLDVVSASIYLGNEFLDTFDSAEHLTTADGLQRVLIVIVMFSTLWAAGILLILTCTGRRKILEPKHKKSMEKIKEQLQKIEGGAKTNSDVRRYLTNYVVEIFPSVFSNKPFFGRLYGEIKRHHRYLTLFTATEGATGDKERILTAVELLSTQTMLMFLLALLYDVQAPTNDGSCATHHSADSCYQRRSPFDNSQAYCIWHTPGTNAADYYCEYAQPEFSLQTVIYISVIVALLTALIQFPLDACMDLLSAPVADELKLAEEETAINKVGRRMSNVARRVSAVASNLTTAAQQKLASTRKSLVGSLARKIPESTEVAHSLASVSMELIAESTQRSLRERELNQIRQFHQSGGRYQTAENAYESDESSSSESSDGGDVENLGRQASKRVHTRPSQRAVTENNDDNTASTSSASVLDASMRRLTAEISCQRRLLVEDERDMFDAQWGLDPTGEFCQGERSRLPFLFKGKPGAQQLIRGELEFVKSETVKKCDKLRVATDQHTGLEILHLFIMDLLGRRTPAARIFETKAMEDFKHTKVVSKNWKRLAVVALVAINAFFVYYSMLTGFRRGLSWQRMYLIAGIVQMVVEITLFETMECVWINCCVPILVSAEVRRVGDSIIEVVQHMCSDEKHVDTSLFLNAPDYLFVSTNVAKKFPTLMESIVVQTYTNHVPGELAKIWQVGSVARITRHQRARNATLTATILAVLQVLGTAPFVIHRMFVRFSQPFVFSAFVLIWQLIISSLVFVAVAVGLLLLFVASCVYLYYIKPRLDKQNSMEVAPIAAQYEDCTPPRQSGATLAANHDATAAARARTVSYVNIPLHMPVLNSNFEVTCVEDEKSHDSGDSSPVVLRKKGSLPTAHASIRASRGQRANSLSNEDLPDGNASQYAHGTQPQLSQKHRPRLASEDSISEEAPIRQKRPHRTHHTARATSANGTNKDDPTTPRVRVESSGLTESHDEQTTAKRGTHHRTGRRRSRAKQARTGTKEHTRTGRGGGHSSEEGSFSHSDSSSDASSD